MNSSEILSCAMDIGEQMLISGAEVYRVEDCIRRICTAYGAEQVDVFTITSSIVLTIKFPGEPRVTETRRITGFSTDLDRVDRLNNLSRKLCGKTPSYEEVQQDYQDILQQKSHSHVGLALIYALVAFSFTIFFGGTLRDGLISLLIAIIIEGTVHLTSMLDFNRALSNLAGAFVMTVLAALAVRLELAQSVDLIVIGNIMLLIPGVGLINSIRDMISGDTIAGCLRFCEVIIHSLAIAGGYILAAYLTGGIV